MNTHNTMETTKTSEGHTQCRLCRDGTYATQTMQSFVGDDNPWEPYCDPCGTAMASVLKDAQGRDAEIRRLPTPPMGKAAPKPVKPKAEPTPKPAKGAKTTPAVDAPVPLSMESPKPPVETRPRMTLAEAMRPTAPRLPPVSPPPPPVSAKSAKNALREAARDVEGYDLLTMLGMKR